LVGVGFLSGENLLSDAAWSRRQMNFHHFHGVHPSCASDMVERKMGVPQLTSPDWHGSILIPLELLCVFHHLKRSSSSRQVL
jgi:hypothetical protein